MKTSFNPSLPFVKKDYPGNELKEGKFTNAPWPDTDASLSNVIKWMFTPNPQREEKKKDKYTPTIHDANDIFTSSQDMIVWLGHATFFIRLAQKNILIDPIFGNLPLTPRLLPFPANSKNIKGLDYLLLSHGHRDHFDVPSLKKVIKNNPKLKILGPLHLHNLVKRTLDNNLQVEEAGWFQQFNTEKIKITYLPALHWHKRGVTDFNTVLWGSFYIETTTTKIFFAGDTAYGSHFTDIKNTMGTPDICILPIGAYKPPFLMNKSHMNPEEAIKAFYDLHGKVFIPMHFGTYDLANEPISEPIRYIRSHLPSNFLKELEPGEKLIL
jgi:L-ascorbate metabolism protein UlaG (beta-lactamase superfamily)